MTGALLIKYLETYALPRWRYSILLFVFMQPRSLDFSAQAMNSKM